MKKVVLRDHPWGSVITIVVGSARELDRYIERRTGEREDEAMDVCRGKHTHYFDERRKERHDIIAVRRGYDRADRTCTLAHEATHLARSLLSDHAAMPLNEQSDEAYAYLIGWIVKKGLPIL